MRTRLIAALALAASVTSLLAQPKTSPAQVTVPLVVEGNRPFVDVTFRRADGTTRTGRFLVDSGGGSFLITEPLARDIGLTWGATSKEEGSEYGSPGTTPSASVGDFALDLTPDRVFG